MSRPTELPATPSLVRCGCLVEQMVQKAIPLKYHNARLADFPQSFLEQDILPWLREPTEGMILAGKCGSGKTYMACALVRAVVESGKKAAFINASDLYREIRCTYDTYNLGERFIMEHYCDAPMLVLDDIGAGSLSDYERRIFLNILNTRGNDCRPTVVTTNLSLDQIRDLMDERISSRLKDYLAVAFTGADRRGRRA